MSENNNMFDFNNPEDEKSLEYRLEDNGHWEYERIGIGSDETGTFMIDLESGDEITEKLYVRKAFSVQDVIDIGLAVKVFAQEDGTYWVNQGDDIDEDSWSKFDKLVFENM